MSSIHTCARADDGYWSDPVNGLANLTDTMRWRVIPLHHSTKTPMVRNWQYGRQGADYWSSTATSRREFLERWTEKTPRPNIGLPTGMPWRGKYVVVLDVDVRNGGDESYAELVSTIGPHGDTAWTRTGSGDGSHHVYLTASTPLGGAPRELGPGLELKRSGQFVVVPPSIGKLTRAYSWINTPWGEPEESGISGYEALEAYIGLLTAPGVQAEESETGLRPEIKQGTWTDTDGLLFEIATAEPGTRHEVLLRNGGKIAYATATGVGLGTAGAVTQALWKACETNGLVEDYGADELLRLIDVYGEWAEPSGNPLFSPSRTKRNASRVFGHLDKLSDSEEKILAHLGTMARAVPHRYSERFAAQGTGLSKTGAGNAIKSLRARGLIEPGRSRPTVLPSGQRTRNTNTYKLTALGNIARNRMLAGLSA